MSRRDISPVASHFMARTCGSANLRRAARMVTSHYERALKPTGISATQLPLLAAIRAGNGTSISCLADALHLERTTISRELDVLERRKLVTTTVADDRRARTLTLTREGKAALAAAYRAWQKAHDDIVGAFGDEKFESLLANMRELGTTVKKLAVRPRKR